MLLIQVCTTANAAITNTKTSIDTYLTKPTGQYEIGFEDIHWINQKLRINFWLMIGLLLL